MIPLVIYTCLIVELTLTTGTTWLVRFFFKHWMMLLCWNALPSLSCLRRFIPTVAFKECSHCPATQKECLKRWGCGPGTDAHRGADHATQPSRVRWVTSVTDDAGWQNPGGERSSRSCQGEIRVCLSRKHTCLIIVETMEARELLVSGLYYFGTEHCFTLFEHAWRQGNGSISESI